MGSSRRPCLCWGPRERSSSVALVSLASQRFSPADFSGNVFSAKSSWKPRVRVLSRLLVVWREGDRMGPTTPAPTTGLQRTWLSAHAGRRKVAANRRPRRFERREECEQPQPKVTGLALSALALAVSCTLSAGVARAEDAVALFENKCAGKNRARISLAIARTTQILNRTQLTGLPTHPTRRLPRQRRERPRRRKDVEDRRPREEPGRDDRGDLQLGLRREEQDAWFRQGLQTSGPVHLRREARGRGRDRGIGLRSAEGERGLEVTSKWCAFRLYYYLSDLGAVRLDATVPMSTTQLGHVRLCPRRSPLQGLQGELVLLRAVDLHVLLLRFLRIVARRLARGQW